MRCTISYHHFRRIYRRCLCARFTWAAISLYISQKHRPQMHHTISPHSSFFSVNSALHHGSKIMNEQKNTKLCRIYSRISSYKWVYFSITLSTFPVTLKLQQLRSCSSFTIPKLAGHWVSYPCVLWLLHTPLRSNSTTKRLLQKTLPPAREALPGERLHAPAGLEMWGCATKKHQTLPAI